MINRLRILALAPLAVLVLFAAGVATEAKVPVVVVDEIPTTLSVSFFCCSW